MKKLNSFWIDTELSPWNSGTWNKHDTEQSTLPYHLWKEGAGVTGKTYVRICLYTYKPLEENMKNWEHKEPSGEEIKVRDQRWSGISLYNLWILNKAEYTNYSNMIKI